MRSSRFTTTDVRKRLSHKIRSPALPLRANKRRDKDKKNLGEAQISERLFSTQSPHSLDIRLSNNQIYQIEGEEEDVTGYDADSVQRDGLDARTRKGGYEMKDTVQPIRQQGNELRKNSL